MHLIKAFLQLIRWQNLVFIILTQALMQFCVYGSLLEPSLGGLHRFLWIVSSSVCIAGAGYIINDYFDLNIDAINKPHKLIINKFINRRWAIVWHFVFNILGLFCILKAVYNTPAFYLFFVNALVIILLWFYSTHFKKQLLVGNLVISCFAAWTVLIIYLSKIHFLDNEILSFAQNLKFFRISILYAGFAFLVTLIREVVKDLEDLEGDIKFGCKTIPVLWGVKHAKFYALICISLLMGLLFILGVYLLFLKWLWPGLYSFILCIGVYFLIAKKILKASNSKQFGKLSRSLKIVMLVGILSMSFFICINPSGNYLNETFVKLFCIYTFSQKANHFILYLQPCQIGLIKMLYCFCNKASIISFVIEKVLNYDRRNNF